MNTAKAQIALDPYIVDVLLADLVGHDKRPAAYVLFIWFWAMTRGIGRPSAFLSYQMITDRTGLSKSAVQRAVAWLGKRKLLSVRRASATAVPEYAALAPWRRD